MTALRLTIENHTSLPDGGPLFYALTGRRGIDIGRDPHLDWVLPDPSRVVSGKHCEIRFRDGGYWLHDVSSNGTYVNGDVARLAAPRCLRDGDRLEIGPYMIAVSVSGAAVVEAPVEPVPQRESFSPQPQADMWGVEGDVAPPSRVDRARRARPLHDVDFIDSAGDIPAPLPPQVPAAQDWAAQDWAVASPHAAPDPAAPARSVPQKDSLPPGLPDQPALSPPVAASAGDAAAFVALFERGAGLPAGALKARAPEEVAALLGRMMVMMTAGLKTLMQARTESKVAMRSASHTTVQALDNNPIPFAPTAEDALRIMLADTGRSYLSGEAALQKTFDALKQHQLETFVAMQAALDGLLKELDPDEIDRGTEPEGGVGNLFGSRKAKLWDIYRTRWQALSAAHPDGIRGAFMAMFTGRYDRGSR